MIFFFKKPMVYIYSGILCSSHHQEIRVCHLLQHEWAWRNIILSAISQTQEDKYCIISLRCEIVFSKSKLQRKEQNNIVTGSRQRKKTGRCRSGDSRQVGWQSLEANWTTNDHRWYNWTVDKLSTRWVHSNCSWHKKKMTHIKTLSLAIRVLQQFGGNMNFLV